MGPYISLSSEIGRSMGVKRDEYGTSSSWLLTDVISTTVARIIFRGDSERFAHFLPKKLNEFGLIGEKSHREM